MASTYLIKKWVYTYFYLKYIFKHNNIFRILKKLRWLKSYDVLPKISLIFAPGSVSLEYIC